MKIEIDQRVLIAMDALTQKEQKSLEDSLISFPGTIQQEAERIIPIGDSFGLPFSDDLILLFEETSDGFRINDLMNRKIIDRLKT